MNPTASSTYKYVFLSLLAVVVLVTSLTKTAMGLEVSKIQSKKSFAVFVANYNPQTGQARGGVAGTAFFTSSTKGITAYHVLQASSFQPPPGFTSSQVWLVHEGEPAIELQIKDIHFEPGKDLTWIDLPMGKTVPSRFVFETAFSSSNPGAATVETEGFLANSSGPILFVSGENLTITDVPSLNRIHAEGTLIAKSKVELKSSDVNLKATNCLQLSYKPIVGLSGGPVISHGKVIAMNSFADPKTRARTWAVEFAN